MTTRKLMTALSLVLGLGSTGCDASQLIAARDLLASTTNSNVDRSSATGDRQASGVSGQVRPQDRSASQTNPGSAHPRGEEMSYPNPSWQPRGEEMSYPDPSWQPRGEEMSYPDPSWQPRDEQVSYPDPSWQPRVEVSQAEPEQKACLDSEDPASAEE